MFRQLLALIALLTGLAALGAPAHALVNTQSRATVEQSASGDTEQRETRSACEEKQRKQKLRGEKVTPCKKEEPVTVYLPSVMFGIDRAYE